MGSGTVETVRTGLIGKIGENISVRRFARMAAKRKAGELCPRRVSKIGVLVDVVDGGADLAVT